LITKYDSRLLDQGRYSLISKNKAGCIEGIKVQTFKQKCCLCSTLCNHHEGAGKEGGR
jgi:hypothetical protein